MWNATIKGLLSHKLRLALTALAIVLGVSFVSGTYVLTDTMNATFSQLFKDTTKGIDVVVQTKQTFASDQGDTRDPVPASLLQQIKSVDGVKVAEGSVNGFAQFIGKNGKAVTTGGAPTLGVSASEAPELNSNFTMRSGRIPAGPNEVAVDAQTASKQGFKVGDQVKVLSQGPTRTYTVSGIVGFGQADNLAGATLAVFDLKTAQQVLDSEGKFNEIDVVTPEQLRDRIAGAVPSKYESITGADQAQRSAKEIQDGLGFFSTALLAFAGVALFVGAFLIFNTFSIIVAQRTRELALLRCLGASRRQVLGSVPLDPAALDHRLAGHADRRRPAAARAVPRRRQPDLVRRRRGGGDLPRRGHPEPADRPAAGQVDRLAVRQGLPASGQPGQAERHAQPAQDLRHGRRADDRSGAGDLRGHLRGLGQSVVRQRARPDGVRRLHRDHTELPGLQSGRGQAPGRPARSAGGHREPVRRLEAARAVAGPPGGRSRRLRQHGPHRDDLGQPRGPAERRPGGFRGRRQAARLEGRHRRAHGVPRRWGPAGATQGHLQGQRAQRRLPAVAGRLPEGLRHAARLDGDRQGQAGR